MLKYYAWSIVSLVLCVLYFTPWFLDPRGFLWAWILASLWFFVVVWVVLLVKVIRTVRAFIKKDLGWKHQLISILIILITCGVIAYGLSNNYFVTV